MRTASRLFLSSLISEGFCFYINFGSPSWHSYFLLLAVGDVVFLSSLISEWFCFLWFGLARLALQFLRICGRSYCLKVVKRIAINCSFLFF